MNSTPAASNARRTVISFGTVIDVSLSASSARLIVAMPTADARAKSSARHRRSARAARIWWLVRGLWLMLTAARLCDILNIIQSRRDHRILPAWARLLFMEEALKADVWKEAASRRCFIGGSDARIIMGDDENALVHLWREKRGRSSRKTYPATSSSSLAWPPRT